MASIDDIWLVDFGDLYPGEPAFHRPALVVGPPQIFGPTFPFVIVAPLTTTRRGIALHVEVAPAQNAGLDRESYVQCELIGSVSRRRLVHHIGVIGPDVSQEVAMVIKMLLNY